jgi:hypothetical protein
VCAAEIWQRTRASPFGTTGNPNPVTNTPSSSSSSLIWIAAAVSPTMIGTIGVSPGSGANPASTMRSRKYAVLARSVATRSGCASAKRTAASELAATVGGSALEKSCGRERWVIMSTTAPGPAMNPPAAPPSALPSVEVMMSTSPSTPKCSAVPRPVAPRTPVACESSMTTTAFSSRAICRISGSLAIAPSIENTPSVQISRRRASRLARSFSRRSSMSAWR